MKLFVNLKSLKHRTDDKSINRYKKEMTAALFKCPSPFSFALVNNK